jgi:hypothetical protein
VNKISEEQVVKNIETVKKLIETFDKSEKKDRVNRVKAMMDGPIGQEFFTAPASQKEDWHNCFPGGLCDHSLRVVSYLMKISSTLCPGKFDPGTLVFVGMFHDLRKVGDGVEPYYVPNSSDWHRKQGNLYEVNKHCVFMPVQERSLYILQNNGIELTSDEYLAIRLHDGQYDETNKRYALHEPDLALLIHFADRWAMAVEKS